MTVARLTRRRTTLEKNRSAVLDMLLEGARPSEIARKFNVHIQSVMQFQQRHAETINQQVAIAEETADVYRISRKVYRVGEHQDLYDSAKREISTAETTQDRLGAIKTALSALHSVAEELGQLPRPDQNINVKALLLVREIDGASLEELG